MFDFQHQLASNLLSPKPDDRLSAADILNHPLLLTEHGDSFTNGLHKCRSGSRSRTMSQSSGNSANSVLGTSLPKTEENLRVEFY